MTFRCHISFEAIISDADESILCNLLNKRDNILEVKGDYVMKGLEGLGGQIVTFLSQRSGSKVWILT